MLYHLIIGLLSFITSLALGSPVTDEAGQDFNQECINALKIVFQSGSSLNIPEKPDGSPLHQHPTFSPTVMLTDGQLEFKYLHGVNVVVPATTLWKPGVPIGKARHVSIEQPSGTVEITVTGRNLKTIQSKGYLPEPFISEVFLNFLSRTDATVLDFPSSSGNFVHDLVHTYNIKAFGADIAIHPWHLRETNYLALADMAQSGFSPETFDVIYSVYGPLGIANKSHPLLINLYQEMWRILKPGGALIAGPIELNKREVALILKNTSFAQRRLSAKSPKFFPGVFEKREPGSEPTFLDRFFSSKNEQDGLGEAISKKNLTDEPPVSARRNSFRRHRQNRNWLDFEDE